MVSRRPHTATLDVNVVTVTNGEYAGTATTNSSITGRLEIGSVKRIKTTTGDTIETGKKFFTNNEKIDGATHLTVDGVKYSIVLWQVLQTHSVIWLD